MARFWRPLQRSVLAAAVLVGATVPPRSGHAQEPLDDDGLGRRPFGRMYMLLEKTFLNIDVMTVEIRFAPAIADELAALAAGHPPSRELTERIAARATHAEDAWVEVRFKRHLGMGTFIGGGRQIAESARRAQVIDEATLQQIKRDLPHWFAFLDGRGIESGDRLRYRILPTSLRTVFIDRDGKVRLDKTDEGTVPRLALLGGYFAPGSDFRNGLVSSLFRNR